MSGFFSLSGKNHDNNQEQQDQHHQTADTGNNNSNNYNLFLLNKNEEIYSKGFEVWQQYYQLHHQRNNHQDVDFSIGPSSGGRRRSIGGGDEPGNYSSYNNNRSAAELGFRVMNHQGRGAVGSDGISCQDCGNQAKKDCEHMRCRTCCKSRGYPCQTHVKSTWVPAARRRERLQQQQQLTTTTTNSSLQTDQQQQQQLAAVRGGENPKRLREGDGRAGGGGAGGSGGGFEVGHFPAELSSPAVFRCVRVSAMDDAEEHLAYQTAVNIGGHVFKGILYDQGPESRYPGGAAGEGPSSAGLIGGGSHQQSLDLIAATTSNTNLTMLDPSIYPSSHQLSGFMAGTQFFLPPRP